MIEVDLSWRHWLILVRVRYSDSLVPLSLLSERHMRAKQGSVEQLYIILDKHVFHDGNQLEINI